MKSARICKGICEKFKMKKPIGKGRYESGQARCQTCDMWIDYKGSHLSSGAAAKKDSLGWFCNCCNMRLRQTPRNAKYKEKFKDEKNRIQDSDNSNTDLSFQQEIPTDQLNHLIYKALNHIKSNKSGVYLSDLQKLLDMSQAGMLKFIPRLERIEGIFLERIEHAEEFLDSLLTYDETENKMSEEVNDESRYQSSKSTVQKDFQEDASRELTHLAQQALSEYSGNKKTINKSLRQSLTQEFFDVKSIKQIAKNHPEISEEIIRNHIKVPLRLPQRLKELNESGLHPKPELSSHIAFFATDHYNWDGEKDVEDRVINMALSLAKQIILLDKSSHTRNKTHVRKNISSRGNTSTAIAIWIAIATLHKEYGTGAIFSNQEILRQVEQQKLCNASHKSISDHIAGHCVANTSSTGSSAYHRKIYRIRSGTYRLYKKGDPYHPTREKCRIEPSPNEMPKEYQDLITWYRNEYCKS